MSGISISFLKLQTHIFKKVLALKEMNQMIFLHSLLISPVETCIYQSIMLVWFKPIVLREAFHKYDFCSEVLSGCSRLSINMLYLRGWPTEQTQNSSMKFLVLNTELPLRMCQVMTILNIYAFLGEFMMEISCAIYQRLGFRYWFLWFLMPYFVLY